jgi:hypothetical protein
MGGGHAGCASDAVLVGTTSPSHWGTYRSITNRIPRAYVDSTEDTDRPTDETTSTGASLLALGVAPVVALPETEGQGRAAVFAPIENFAVKARLGVRSALTLRTAIRFRLAARIQTYV